MEPGETAATEDIPQAFQLAMNHHGAGRLAEAERVYRRVLTAAPGHPGALNNLGNVLCDLGRFRESEQCYRQALAIAPDQPEILSNLGNTLNNLGRHEEAEICCRRAYTLKPDHLAACQNLGNALQALGRLEDAERSFREALALEPAAAEVHKSLGTVLYAEGRMDEALHCMMQAQAIEPGNTEARGYEGMLRLLLGDYATGWKLYEERWRVPGSGLTPRNFVQPLWRGSENLNGKTILVYAEQGLGDSIQFARYVPLLAARGATVILEVPGSLVPLMAGLQGASRIIAAGSALPSFDFHAPLLNLPLAFETTLQTIPAPIPYLSVDRKNSLALREQLTGAGDALIGVCWKGDPRNNTDRKRSIGVSGFAPLLSVPRARFVSLHKELDDQEREITRRLPNFTHPGADFSRTAEIVAALDRVITVDTAWAHWAGAIGKPVWILLPSSPDWRWLMDREDSPWYPTARLFRQSRRGDWHAPVQEAAKELRRCVG